MPRKVAKQKAREHRQSRRPVVIDASWRGSQSNSVVKRATKVVEIVRGRVVDVKKAVLSVWEIERGASCSFVSGPIARAGSSKRARGALYPASTANGSEATAASLIATIEGKQSSFHRRRLWVLLRRVLRVTYQHISSFKDQVALSQP